MKGEFKFKVGVGYRSSFLIRKTETRKQRREGRRRQGRGGEGRGGRAGKGSSLGAQAAEGKPIT